MTIIKQRGTLCGACIVTLALGFGAAPAWAQQNFNPLPPQVRFISNGKFTGTLQTRRLPHPLPITGTIAYLTGDIEYEKISVDTPRDIPITSNTWLKQTSTDINEWETVSTFPFELPR